MTASEPGLYFLEHIFLPALIQQGADDKAMSPFAIGNFFSGICAKVIHDLKETGEAQVLYTEKDFTAVPLEIKDEHDGHVRCYVLQMNFPFAPKAGFGYLCPRAYLVHGPSGENPFYYTVEYQEETGDYQLCAWEGELHHNYGKAESDPRSQLQAVLHQEKCRQETLLQGHGIMN